MATKDEVLTESDDDIDVVEVDALPGEEAKAAEAAAEKKDEAVEVPDPDDDDEEHQEDARLAEKDEGEEEKTEREKRKLGQRQRQKLAKQRTENELAELRHNYSELLKRVGNVESTNLSVSEGMITSKLEEVRRDIATAEAILADAVKNADGDSYTTALRLRDEAKAQESDLVVAQKGFVEAKKAPNDSEAAQLSSTWKAQNPWYGSPGYERQTNLVNAIDNGMFTDAVWGKLTNNREYYRELSRRVGAALPPAEDTQRRETTQTDDNRRKGPPTGARGNGANGNGTGKRVVHLSKDRVDAIKQAGDWDDPVERAKAIKAYEAYDREQSAGR